MARKKIPYKELKRLSREVDREMKLKVDVRKLVNHVRKLVNHVKNWRPEMKKVEKRCENCYSDEPCNGIFKNACYKPEPKPESKGERCKLYLNPPSLIDCIWCDFDCLVRQKAQPKPESKGIEVEIEKNKTTGRLYITYNPKLEKKFKLGATRKFTITENK